MGTQKGPMKFALALILPVAFVLTGGNALAQEDTQEEDLRAGQQQCEATLELAAISAEEQMLEVKAELSEDIGQTTAIEAEQQSGIRAKTADVRDAFGQADETATEREEEGQEEDPIREDEREDEDEDEGEYTTERDQETQEGQDRFGAGAHSTVNLELDTSDANEGNWQLTIQGERGTCNAQIEVMGDQAEDEADPFGERDETETEPEEEEEDDWPPIL